MTNKLTDRLFLVLSAVTCSGLIVLSIVFVRPRLSQEWSKFVFACIGYLAVLIATGFTARQLKRLSKGKIILFQVIFYFITVGIAYLTFKSGLFPLPKGSFIYVLPITALSALSVVALDYLRKRLKFFEGIHRGR